MALTLPLAMKLGLTKAVRALPIAYLLVVFAAVMAAQGMFGQMDAASVLGLLPEGAGLGLLAVLMLAVALALYGGSYVVTRRLYAKRNCRSTREASARAYRKRWLRVFCFGNIIDFVESESDGELLSTAQSAI